MKSLKFAVLATLLVFALVSVARADGFTGKPKPLFVINLTFAKAMATPGLAAAMHEQLSLDDFLGSPQEVYVAEVTFNGVLYRITGTLGQWAVFFFNEGVIPVKIKGEIHWGIG